MTTTKEISTKTKETRIHSRMAAEDKAGNRVYVLRPGLHGYWWVRTPGGDEMVVHEDELRPAND